MGEMDYAQHGNQQGRVRLKSSRPEEASVVWTWSQEGAHR